MTTEPVTDTQQQPRNPEKQGALFKNDKGDNPKRPDYRGRCTINGKELKISAWIKEDRGGKKYLSLAFQENTNTNGNGDGILDTSADTPTS